MRRTLIGASVAVTAATALALGASPALADEVALTASGTGEEEVPAGSGEAGATVEGEFVLDTDEGTLTYTVTVEGNSEEITAGHIHVGEAGVNGDVVVPLDTAAVQSGEEATVEVEVDIAEAIESDPAGFYLNVHSDSFAPPTGNARGQLEASAPTSVPSGDGTSAGTSTTALAGGVLLVAGVGAVAVGAARRRRTA